MLGVVRNMPACTSGALWRRRCAAGIYILRCAPVLLAPFGVVTALVYLLLGSLLTIAGAVALVVSIQWSRGSLAMPMDCRVDVHGHDGAHDLVFGPLAWLEYHVKRPSNYLQVVVWFTLSEPVAASRVATMHTQDAAAAAAADSSMPADAEAAVQQAQERVTYAQLVEDMIPMAGGREGPPPALALNGEFSDWVYTMGSEKYDRNEVMNDQRPCLSSGYWWSLGVIHSESSLHLHNTTGTCELAAGV